MCLGKYRISTCHLNIFIFSGLMILFSSFGLNSNSKDKIVGNINLQETCIILFITGIILFIYSLKNLCYRRDYIELP